MCYLKNEVDFDKNDLFHERMAEMRCQIIREKGGNFGYHDFYSYDFRPLPITFS